MNVFGFSGTWQFIGYTMWYAIRAIRFTKWVKGTSWNYLRSKLHMANELFRLPQIWMFPIWWQTLAHVLPYFGKRPNLSIGKKEGNNIIRNHQLNRLTVCHTTIIKTKFVINKNSEPQVTKYSLCYARKNTQSVE